VGVTYGDVRAHSLTNADGQVVVNVSASAWLAHGSGYTWVDDLGAGWQLNELGSARYEGERIVGSVCGEVTLAQPTITGNTCTDGLYTPPSAAFGPTGHVTYTKVKVWENSDRTYDLHVIADVDAGYAVAMPLGEGWVLNGVDNPNQYYYSGTVQMVPCAESEVIPAQPVITGSTCVDGVYTPPSAAFGPTEHVTYDNVRAYSRLNADGQVVVVTSASAYADRGYTWSADLGAGWQDSGVWGAHYQGEHIAGSLCGEVTPAQPIITGNTCVDGVYTPPSATFGPTEHVTYDPVWTHWEFQDGRYVVFVSANATLADGYAWTSELGEGWEQYTGNFQDAHYSGGGQVTWNFCDGAIILAQPTITGNTCVNGEYTLPKATFGPTEHVSYSGARISEGTNGTFVVRASAELETGYNWAQDQSSGWILYTGKGGGNYYQGVFPKTACEASTVVTPVDPAVTQAVLTGPGEVTPPSVTLATTEGIAYSMTGDVVPGGAVTVTATPNEGYILGPATGWTMHDGGTATFTVHLDDVGPSPSLVEQIIRILIQILTRILRGVA
jgi:hypothetical protein